MYEASGISLFVQGRTILDGVDLALAPGEVTVLVGPNGAGKSSLVKVMAGAIRPTAGRVLLHGREVTTWSPRALAGLRAVLSQSVGLAFAFSVGEVVRLGLPEPLPAGRAEELVARALGRVGLDGIATRDCTSLSGGEQQRVHLARVLVQLWAAPADGRARYLLLDEPTAGLDLAYQLRVLEIAREHAAAGGGVLAILHDLNLAALAGDRIVALDGGRAVADGAPEEVITDRLLADVYRVNLKVNMPSGRVFVLPARD